MTSKKTGKKSVNSPPAVDPIIERARAKRLPRITRDTKRLSIADPRVQPLLTDEQRQQAQLTPERTIKVEVSPMSGERGLIPTRTGDIDGPLRDFKLSIDEDEFVSALSLQPEDSKWGRLHSALSIPGASFMKVVKHQGLSLLELNDFWHDAQQHTGMIRMLNHLPDVMEETAMAARQKTLTCGQCNGKGYIYKEEREVVEIDGKLQYKEPQLFQRDCPSCIDSPVKGKVVEPGDVESKRLLFKVAGLMNDGVNVNVNNNSLTFNGIEAEVSNIGKILERRVDRPQLESRVESEPIIDVEDVR